MENGLKILSQMDFEAKRELYRNVPDHAIARTRFDDRTANGLTKSILAYLQLKGNWATRINTTGRYLHHQKKWIPGTTQRGTADIHAVINGRHVSIEVKVGRDQLSDKQLKVKREVQRAGGVYVVARSFDQFYDWYEEFFKQLNNKQDENN
jgi:hypothetical protein